MDPQRILPNIIEGYVEYLAPCEVPASFKRWAGVALVAGAMERRFWAHGRGYKIHPNVFILIIARPGVGKNVVIDPVVDIWSASGKFNIMANRSSLAAFLEAAQAPQLCDIEGEKVLTNPSVMGLGEFGHLFRENDTEMMNAINAFYDAKDAPFVDRTISRGVVTIDKPILTLIAGTQPQYLDKVLPEQAFQLGFATRLIMQYEVEVPQGTVFGKQSRPSPELFRALVNDVSYLKTLSGEFQFDQEAQEEFESWHSSGCAPVPEHLRLQDYNTRRWASAFKLCQILQISQSDELVIRKPIVRKAIDMLLTAEETLPAAFSAMGGDSDSTILSEAYDFVVKFCMSKKTSCREPLLIGFLSKKVQVHRIRAIVETLVTSGKLKVDGAGPVGLRTFIPGDLTEV